MLEMTSGLCSMWVVWGSALNKEQLLTSNPEFFSTLTVDSNKVEHKSPLKGLGGGYKPGVELMCK